MGYFIFVLGIGVGTSGYFLYDKYFSAVYTLGKALYEKAEGNTIKALQHIEKLV